MRRKSFSISQIIVFIVLISTTLCLSISTVLIFLQFRSQFIKNITSNYESSITQVNTAFDTFYQQLVYIIFQISNDDNTKRYLSDEPEDQFEYTKNRQYIENFLNSYAGFFVYNDINIILYGKNDITYSTYENTLDLKHSGFMSLPFIFDTGSSRNRLGFLYDYPGIAAKNTSTNYTYVSKAMFNYQNNVYGYIILAISKSCFNNLYYNLLSDNSYFFVLSSDKTIISSSDKETEGTTSNELYKFTEKSSGSKVKYNSKKYLFIKAYNKYWKTYLIQLVPYTSITQKVVPLLVICSIIFFVITALSTLVIMFIVRFFTEPIKKFANSMKNSTLNSPPLQFSSCLELNILVDAFNQMNQKLNSYINEIMQSQEKRHLLEYETLQNQIQPHFIYNTLSSIKYLFLSGETQKAIDGISSFILVLRQIISDRRKEVPLRDSINLVQNYFKIQQLRYGNKIHLNINIPEEYYNYRMPKLLLQPIVENSIFHGFTDMCPEGSIDIYASVQDEILSIDIIDNGKGMSEQEILKVMNPDNNTEKKSKLTGIGLLNIQERIKNLYGQEFGLKICSVNKMGTQITVCIPTIPYVDTDN